MKRKDKDVGALWEEVKRLTLEMGRLQQQYDEQTACVIVHRGSMIACSDAMRAAYYDEHYRAEWLAEALQKLEEHRQSDEALLRQALEALERGAWDTLSVRNAAFAIRENLGLEQEDE